MTQIIFYSTAPLQVEKTLFTLLEKSLEKRNKSLLLFKDKEKCLSINEQLWTYKQNSFLPHISEDDQIYDNIDVPVYLSTKNENPFKAELLFSIDGFLPDNIDHFERVIIIIDVNDELLNEKYKNYYLDINKNFEDIVFYKSDDNGKWIEKNFMR
ncbi:MAG: DNA polymerase III subunit chi [Pseudomonadota bacterium]|nr:DNA polymerase III subunit chi [Pseudomonadota bacterium]MED5254456.1 DNA polymerase III subunit chi [Pseudomonadota bacterium]MED5273345.1 DNA polymerase III subunit chi [Pseudomonadota bacterium]